MSFSCLLFRPNVSCNSLLVCLSIISHCETKLYLPFHSSICVMYDISAFTVTMASRSITAMPSKNKILCAIRMQGKNNHQATKIKSSKTSILNNNFKKKTSTEWDRFSLVLGKEWESSIIGCYHRSSE